MVNSCRSGRRKWTATPRQGGGPGRTTPSATRPSGLLSLRRPGALW